MVTGRRPPVNIRRPTCRTIRNSGHVSSVNTIAAAAQNVPRTVIMTSVIVMTSLLLAGSGVVSATGTTTPRCSIRCGVITEQRPAETAATERGTANSVVPLHQFVSSVWNSLRSSRSLFDVDIEFEPTEYSGDMTMNSLFEAYIKIGSTNLSAIIGPYVQPVLTASQKSGIPYFVTDEPPDGHYRPYNLLSVRPHPSDIYRLTVDLVRHYGCSAVAVLYDGTEGAHIIEGLVRWPPVQVRAWLITTATDSEQMRDVLLEVRRLGISDVIVSVSSNDVIKTILDTNGGDTLAELLKLYVLTGVNLTTYRLVLNRFPAGDDVTVASAKWRHQTELYATVHDTLLTLYYGVLLRAHDGLCQWTGRDHLLSTLVKIQAFGLSGELSYRADGTRKGFSIGLLSLQTEGLAQIGVWNTSSADPTNAAGGGGRLHFNVSGPWGPSGGSGARMLPSGSVAHHQTSGSSSSSTSGRIHGAAPSSTSHGGGNSDRSSVRMTSSAGGGSSSNSRWTGLSGMAAGVRTLDGLTIKVAVRHHPPYVIVRRRPAVTFGKVPRSAEPTSASGPQLQQQQQPGNDDDNNEISTSGHSGGAATDAEVVEGFQGYAIDLLDAVARQLHCHMVYYDVATVAGGQLPSAGNGGGGGSGRLRARARSRTGGTESRGSASSSGHHYRSVDYGIWTGLVEQLTSQNATLAAVVPMTSLLNDAIDFTIPIRTSGIGLAYRRSSDAGLNPQTSSIADSSGHYVLQRLMLVFRPLTVGAWLLLPLAFVAIAIVVYVAERTTGSTATSFSGSNSRSTAGDAVHRNSIHLSSLDLSSPKRPSLGDVSSMVLSALLLQTPRWATSSDDVTASRSTSTTTPQSLASRVALSVAGVFSLALLTAYAANMAAIRLSSQPVATHVGVIKCSSSEDPGCSGSVLATTSIAYLRDLVERRDINFSVPSPTDLSILSESADPIAIGLERLVQDWRLTWRTSGGVADSNLGDVGPEIVLASGSGSDRTVFIGDSLAASYASRISCGAVGSVEVLDDTRFFAFGLRRGGHGTDDSDVREAINYVLLELTEQGFVKQLQNRWWLPDVTTSSCSNYTGSVSATFHNVDQPLRPVGNVRQETIPDVGLDVVEVGGLLVLLASGLMTSLAVAAGQWVWKHTSLGRKYRRHNQQHQQPQRASKATNSRQTSGQSSTTGAGRHRNMISQQHKSSLYIENSNKHSPPTATGDSMFTDSLMTSPTTPSGVCAHQQHMTFDELDDLHQQRKHTRTYSTSAIYRQTNIF